MNIKIDTNECEVEITDEVMKCDGENLLQKTIAFLDTNQDLVKECEGLVINEDGDISDFTIEDAIVKIYDLDISTHYEATDFWFFDHTNCDRWEAGDSNFTKKFMWLNIKKIS